MSLIQQSRLREIVSSEKRGGEELGKHTVGVQHPLDGARETGRFSLHYELEAIIADKRHVVRRFRLLCICHC